MGRVETNLYQGKILRINVYSMHQRASSMTILIILKSFNSAQCTYLNPLFNIWLLLLYDAPKENAMPLFSMEKVWIFQCKYSWIHFVSDAIIKIIIICIHLQKVYPSQKSIFSRIQNVLLLRLILFCLNEWTEMNIEHTFHLFVR